MRSTQVWILPNDKTENFNANMAVMAQPASRTTVGNSFVFFVHSGQLFSGQIRQICYRVDEKGDSIPGSCSCIIRLLPELPTIVSSATLSALHNRCSQIDHLKLVTVPVTSLQFLGIGVIMSPTLAYVRTYVNSKCDLLM